MKPDGAQLLRAVRWARLPGHGHTIAEACARFGISASVYRKARRELGAQADIFSDEELILAGLHPSGPVAVEALVYYYSWINHGGISPKEVRAILARLIARKMVRRGGAATS